MHRWCLGLVAGFALLASCSNIPGETTEPLSPVSPAMSGEYLILANEFVECMEGEAWPVLDVAVEIWEEYDVVTDITYKLLGSRSPDQSIVDGCLLAVNEVLRARRSED